ncbi:CMRF35-like molecule 6 [Gymnodraco acuticeps]|uniref:CMRF35-like molecule 6 n=1 Tax=Gymnodraco acuticeps TaxID=8218 RepID=A0A6P8W381_GYMAC|nr:CMRF35-like molecule 6 [Gymnodraco acuticeps]
MFAQSTSEMGSQLWNIQIPSGLSCVLLRKDTDPHPKKASLQLQCDKKQITAPLGSDFLLSCSYKNQLLSNKYWCRGESRRTCEVLVDSEGKTRSTRVHIVDARSRGLFVRVLDLQKGDSGVYWVGIDRPYTAVPVSKPRLQTLVSLMEGSTCRGGSGDGEMCVFTGDRGPLLLVPTHTPRERPAAELC